MHRSRRVAATRAARAALAAGLLGTAVACTSALEGDDASSVEGGRALGDWPELEVAGTGTTPVNPEVTVEVHDVMRSQDGLTTLLLDVVNGGNDDVTLGDVFGYSRVPSITLYDPEANVRHGPVQIDDDVETGGCLCSSSSVGVAAGETTTMYVTYEGLDDEAESVRVQMPRFTPVADVPVRNAGPFVVQREQPAVVEEDDDLSVTVEWAAPTDGGTLVQLRYTNEGRSEPVPVSDFPDPGDLSLVDADGSAIFHARESGVEEAGEVVDQDDLRRGDSAVAQVLVAELPDATESVLLAGPGLRRSLPVPVADEPETPDFPVPGSLDEEDIDALHSPSWRYNTPLVPTARPELPPVDEVGAELPVPDVTQTLTSEAQPGWKIGVRAVVRGPGEFSTLLLDVTRDGGDGFWPEGLGADRHADDLGGLAVIDPASRTRLGVYRSDTTAFSANDGYHPSDGETVRAYAMLPALDAGSQRVTVDVPTFGEAEDVPVVDGPTEPAGGAVPATLRPRDNDRLRMDVLTVSHLGEGNGTLVRARMVNESDPDAVTTPFVSWSDDGLCVLKLTDPETGDRYQPLSPCQTTAWEANLARGEQLEFEVRFPELPDDLDDVVVSAGGYYPAGPVPVTKGERPWYLALPATAEDPEGTVYTASRGTADGLETTIRTGDTVEVRLDADVLFEFDSAQLTGDAVARLAELAGRVDEGAAAGTVTITGYTDDVGDDDYNQQLSEQRAEAVRAALEPATDRSDLTFDVSGRGEADPVAPNRIDGRDNPDGRERNRRVTVVYEAE